MAYVKLFIIVAYVKRFIYHSRLRTKVLITVAYAPHFHITVAYVPNFATIHSGLRREKKCEIEGFVRSVEHRSCARASLLGAAACIVSLLEATLARDRSLLVGFGDFASQIRCRCSNRPLQCLLLALALGPP